MRKLKNAILLAGGDSTRFWPLEEKNFFSFLGKPLILYQIEEISRFVEKITIIASQTNVVFIKRLIENSHWNSICQVIIQKDLSGQAGALLSVKNLVKGESIVLNVNDVLDYSILDKLTSLPSLKNKIVLYGKKVNEYFPGGYFKFDSNGKIEEVVEKPDKDKTPSNIVKLVVDYYSNIDNLIKLLEAVKTKEDNHYELAINNLLESGIDREYVVYDGNWQTLKYSWHVLPMMRLFFNKIKKHQISPKSVISEKALIIGPVIIEDNVKVGDFAKIVGPAYIGENSVIGDYSLVRETQVGADCLIGSYTEVARSYIGNKVYLHRNYIGDSVLSDEVMMGAQAATANFRFDGKTVRSVINHDKIDSNLHKFGAIVGKGSKIGVNSIILPGIKIGKNTLIAPHHSISEDVAENLFVRKGIFKNKT
jgi:bifunctional UDP-N-acetylglucosamine pyrophosphorylase/glucosamine-1-phosphate N-acetyltransferase